MIMRTCVPLIHTTHISIGVQDVTMYLIKSCVSGSTRLFMFP